jgi:hypothetical protein
MGILLFRCRNLLSGIKIALFRVYLKVGGQVVEEKHHSETLIGVIQVEIR